MPQNTRRNIPLDIAYSVVAHILQSSDQARRDFLVHGREGRLRWWKAPPLDDWIHNEEPVASDFLKLCELIEIQWYNGSEFLYLAVRGEINPDVDTTIEMNGEVLRVLVNDRFGLSRDDLIKIYPQLAPKNHLAPKVHEIVTALIGIFPPHGNPGQLSEKTICDRLLENYGIWVGPPPDKPNPKMRVHVARSTFREALKRIRR